MTFDDVLAQVLDLLQRQGRVSYSALRRRFEIDESYLNDLKDELIFSHPVVDEDGRGLVWTGETDASPVTPSQPNQPESQPVVEQTQPIQETSSPVEHHTPDAERRQLTVMFCDLVDSTKLSSQLDPEDYREVVRAYQATCAEVIQPFDCYIAQTLGDGLLIYSGYPVAHENDAERAVRVGLGILDTMKLLNERLERDKGIRLGVRVGIHTGPVVVGDVGAGARQEQLALGEVPNIAARIQGLAQPDSVLLSLSTYRLIQGYFDCQALGEQTLRGVAEPRAVYRVLQESGAQSRLDIASTRGLTPLVGRAQETELLLECWNQVKDGQGQVILLNGEGGIGKSRLVQELKNHVADEAHTRLECRSSPYFTNSALYPIINMIQRTLQFQADDAPGQKLQKLEQNLSQHRLSMDETVPLFASLLSLPVPEDRYPSLNLSPQQRQKTLETIIALVLELAERQPVLFIIEDLHFTDPSTLELLNLLIDQTPTAAICVLLTCRPEFQPTWSHRSHLTEVTLSRLSQTQVERMAQQVTGGKGLPTEVLQQLVNKTDGVPLYIEEMTKMVLESGLLQEREMRYELTGPLPLLAIPATLHDSLMARLDRLATVKGIAQFGATLGREFSYVLLQAVSPWDEETLRHGLQQLVEAEFLYQRGLLPQATYTFKHALIQDAAYQSLLRSIRQQYHQRIAQVLETRFPEICETQPELLAHHCTEAGRSEQAIDYCRQAGAKAAARSAYREAVTYFEQALAALKQLPESRERQQEAIDLYFNLRNVLLPLGEQGLILEHLRAAETFAAALGDRSRLGWVSVYMTSCFYNTGQADRAVESGQRALAVALALGDFSLQVQAAYYLGLAYHLLGDYHRAVEVLRGNVASLTGELIWERFGLPYLPSVFSRNWLVWGLAELGAFAEAVASGEEGVRIAKAVDQPWDLLAAYRGAGLVCLGKGDVQRAVPWLERCLQLCQDWDIAGWFAVIASQLGYAYALSGRMDKALPLLEQAVGQSISGRSVYHARLLGYLGEAYLIDGRPEEALPLAMSALELSRDRKEQGFQAYTLRLLGDITTRRNPPDIDEAETYYQQALALADELGMRPLQTHCHRGLGTLYRQTEQSDQARAELSTAIDMYRDMEMTFWLPETEAALAAVEGKA